MLSYLVACRVAIYAIVFVLVPQNNVAVDEPATRSPLAQSILVQGVARFSDGNPLANSDLDVSLDKLDDSARKDVNLPAITLRCSTDAEGQFEFPLPEQVRFSATVVATKWSDGNRGCWRGSIPILDGHSKVPIDLQFENHGRIVIAFFGMSNLTRESEVVLTCTSAGTAIDAQFRHTRRLDADFRSPLILDGLEPREYIIEVSVPSLYGQSWAETVSVPAQSPFRALAKFHFPESHFGTFEAQFLLPDGKTPAVGKQFQAECVDQQGRSFGRKQLFTDAVGRVDAKMPAGNVCLRYIANRQTAEDAQLAPAEFTAKIQADEHVNLGALRLKSVDEVFAVFDGTITCSSGELVKEIHPLGRVTGHGHLLAENGGALPFDPHLKPVGYFKMQVTSGKQVVAVGLEGTGRMAGGFAEELKQSKCILFELDLTAGKKHRQDVVIPDPERPRRLVVNTDVEHGFNAVASVLVEVAPHVYWNVRQLVEEKRAVFEGLPEGKAFVVFQSDTIAYLAARELPPVLRNHEIDFSQNQVGRLRVQLEDSIRMQRDGFELFVSVDTPLRLLTDVHIAARGVPATNAGEPSTSTENRRVTRDANGALIAEGLAEGTYCVRTVVGDKQLERKVEVVRDKTTSVQF